MKKSLILTAIAAIALAGCSKENNDNQHNDTDVITFRALGDKALRGTVVEGSNFLGFKVFAYETAETTLPASGQTPAFLYNTSVTRPTISDAWSYSPARTWPATTNIHFFAYGPESANASFLTAAGAAGQPEINFTVDNSVANQCDLVWSAKEGCDKATYSSTPVTLTFKHALSQMTFQAKSANSILKFSVSKIEVLGLKNSARFNLKTGAWNNLAATTANYTLDGALLANNTAVDNSAFVTLSAAANGTMMLLPQSLTKGQASPVDLSSGTYLRITFGAKDGDIPIVAEGTTMTVPFGGFALEANKRYTIQLTLSGNNDTSDPAAIEFSGTVSSWETPNVSSPINI